MTQAAFVKRSVPEVRRFHIAGTVRGMVSEPVDDVAGGTAPSEELGWAEDFADAWEELGSPGQPGRISRLDRGWSTVIRTMTEARGQAEPLRLRNIGGMAVIDFLRMNDSKDRKALLSALDDVTYSDPCTVQIHGFTKLGLMEISRKRRTPPLADRCEGVTF